MGVSAAFFFPIFVAALTSADEFHSVTNTRCPAALSHFASSPSCVVFPDPSIPSTTNSLPRYSCGFVRLFSIGVPTDLESERLAKEPFERAGVTAGGPELELGVAGGPDLEQAVLAAVVELHGADGLLVAAVEALREPQNGCKRSNARAALAAKVAEGVVAPLRCGLTVVSRDERDRVDLLRLEAAQIAVANQVLRVFVVALVADVHADVVQDRGVLERLALTIGQPVNRARLIEQGGRQPRNLVRVLRPEVAALGEL